MASDSVASFKSVHDKEEVTNMVTASGVLLDNKIINHDRRCANRIL